MDDFNKVDEQIDLSEFVPKEAPLVTLPVNAIRNKAATAALVSGDGEKATEAYQGMLAEGLEGKDNIYKTSRAQTAEKRKVLDMQGVMTIMSDPTVPMERKREIMASVNSSNLLDDDKTLLHTNSLTAPSKGENKEQETARITVADSVRKITKARSDVQGLVNAHAASLGPVELNLFSTKPDTLDEMIEAWVMPFGNSISTYKIAKAQADKEGRQLSMWEKTKIFMLPGTATSNLVDGLESLPPEEQIAYTKSLIDTISKNSGIIFTSQNQFAQFDKAVNIWSEGGYSGTQEFLDNVSPLLDLIGVGQALRASRLSKALKTAPATAPLPDAVKAPTALPSGSVAAPADVAAIERQAKQAEAKRKIEEQWNFDLSLPTESKPQGPISGILSEPTTGVSVLEGGSGAKAVPEAPKKQTASLFKPKTEEQIALEKRSEEAAAQAVPNKPYEDDPVKLKEIKERGTVSFPGNTSIPARLRRVETNGTVAIDNPASPAKIIQQGNPEQARSLHAAVFGADNTVSEALYGTERTDAIASDILPQFTVTNGAITSRVMDIGRDLRTKLNIEPELTEIMHSSGALELTRDEKAAARANVMNDFSNASGLTINDAMSSFSVDGGRIRIGAVYGSTEGGFLLPEAALQQALVALRSQGVRMSDLTILAKDGLDHVPVKLEDVIGKEGNYLIRLDTFHDIDPTDIAALEKFDVKRNFTDRVSPWIPGLTDPARWIADAASMLHPVYTSAASNAIDLTSRFDKYLLDLASEYSDKWKALSKDRRGLVNDYIREANFNEIKFDVTDLSARGFAPEEISAISSWRKFWDAHYYLENYDIVRTLNAEGFELFENANTKLVAKQTTKNTTLGGDFNAQGTKVVGGTKLYNPAGNDVTVLTKIEIDQLYANGGYLAKLRRPTDFNGTVAEFMIVRNTPTEYLRKVRESDEILNYREGYFQLQYKAPRFVDEIVKDAAGNPLYRRALAVAGDTKEAEAFAARMRAQGKDIPPVRGDDRALQRGSDDWWDVNAASGRIAQRYRGKLLEDSNGVNHLGDGSYILNPVESAIRAAKSIAGRTISRPMLETAKARFMNQYSELIPSNGMGGVKFPSRLGEIGAKGEQTSERVADARTTWQYIHYLENGYINGIDNFVKASLNSLAQVAGEAGFTKTERAAGILAEGGGGPISLARNLVFTAYLGTNPLRQLIVQTHQVVRTWAYNPAGWLTGSSTGLATAYLGRKMGLTVPIKDGEDFIKFMNNSGLLDSVDKQNLVRGSLTDAAESSNKVARTISKGLAVPRKIGFDTGEVGNLLGHGASVYDMYRRRGANLADKTVRAEMVAEIRALSYEMNFAGDMPYNQTSPSMVLQFMQVPHKAFLQMTNRKLPGWVRFRMFATDTLLWGPPTLIASALLGGDILPDNKEWRERITWGVESIMLNHLFTELFGKETDIDWSGLAPYDVTGWLEFFKNMYSEGFDQVLMNSPAGQLFFKDGGRFDNAVSSMARYFAGFVEEQQKPEDFLGMLNNVAKMSSGYNNAQAAYAEWIRAGLASDAIRRLDKYGSAVDKTVTTPEIIMKAFGFGTQSTRDLYALSKITSKDNKAYKEDVLKVYNSAKQYYADKLGTESNDPRTIQALTGFIFNTFRDSPEALNIIKNQRVLDLTSKDQGLLYQMMKRSGLPGAADFKDDIRRSPLTDQEKSLLLERIDGIEKARTALENMKKETK